jgi:hypothetical protein
MEQTDRLTDDILSKINKIFDIKSMTKEDTIIFSDEKKHEKLIDALNIGLIHSKIISILTIK